MNSCKANPIISFHGAEAEFLNHCPASMAAAAVLSAVTEIPGMSCVSISPETAASWCPGVTEVGN